MPKESRTTASSLAPNTPSLVLGELGSYHFQFWVQQAREGRFLACRISQDSDNVEVSNCSLRE